MRGRLRVLWELYAPVRPYIGAYLILLVVGTAVEGLALSAIVPLIDTRGDGAVGGLYGSMMEAVGLDPSSEWHLVALVGGLFILRSAFHYTSQVLAGSMVRRQAVRQQVELFRLYLGLRWDVAVRLPHGEVTLLLSTHTLQVGQFLGRCILLLEGATYVIGLTLVAVVVSPESTLLAIGLVGVSAIGVSWVVARLRTYANRVLDITKAEAASLLQYARGFTTFRAFDVSEHAVEDIENVSKRRETMLFHSQRIESLAFVLPDLAFVIALLLVVALALQSENGFAEVGAVVALLLRVSQYLKRFSEVSTASSMLPVVRDVHRRQQFFAANQAPSITLRVDPRLDAGSIELDAVCYQYPEAPAPAIRDVSARIEPGTFLGIVGASGSGKTTLVQLIIGLLEPDTGSIRIGMSQGTELRPIAYVAQDPFLLEGSIADNVRWFRPVSDSSVRAACTDAGLDGLLERLPAGLETKVGQEGATLSGGERQRIALARALAGQPEILLLDEATSALDSESERVVQAALERLRGKVTVVAVAHRLSTVMGADRIWVVEGGAIVEDATPRTLLDEATSRFAQLSSMQGIRRSE